jgi:hypothetical protein
VIPQVFQDWRLFGNVHNLHTLSAGQLVSSHT